MYIVNLINIYNTLELVDFENGNYKTNISTLIDVYLQHTYAELKQILKSYTLKIMSYST